MRRIFLKYQHRLLVGFLLIFFSLASSVFAQSLFEADPTLIWQTIETSHFRINYHEGLEGLAQEAAVEAEAAFVILNNEFGYTPLDKTDIVIIDAADDGASFTTWYGESVIDLSVANLAERENSRSQSWMQFNLFQGYSQVLETIAVSGFPSTLREVFGYAALPNWKPLLLMRGSAAYYARKHLGDSSANDSLSAMHLRTMVLENQFVALDRAGTAYSRRAWPSVSVLSRDYGAWFVRFLNERFGAETTKNLHHSLAGNGLAFLSLEATLKQLIKRSIPELFQDFQSWSREQFAEQIGIIQSEGVTLAHRLTIQGYHSQHPSWSPDGKEILYDHQDVVRVDGIRTVSADGKNDHPLLSRARNPSWSANGQQILYIKTELEKYSQSENTLWAGDLYLYDLLEKRETRLTRGERVYRARFFPDGKRILFAKYRWGDQGPMLAILELSTQRIISLKEFGFNDYFIQSFALSPDGQQIALSIWRRGGYQDIYRLSSNGGELTALTLDKEADIDPTWSSDGQYILFSSDRTGVYNLFAYQLSDGSFYRVTNMLTGAFQPDVSPDDQTIAFAGYSIAGYDVHTMKYDPESWQGIEMVKDTFPPWDGFPATDYPIHSYDARLSLSPRLWFPLFDTNSVGLWTFGQDALFKHRYTFSFGWDWKTHLPFYRFSYINHQSLPTLSFALEKKLRQSGKPQQDATQDALISLPFIRALRDRVNLVFSYHRLETEKISHRVGAELSWAHQRGFDLWQNQWKISVAAETTTSTGDIYWRNQAIFGIEDTLRLPLEATHLVSIRLAVGYGKKANAFSIGGENGKFSMRSFESDAFSGAQAFVGSLEYQFPLFSIERGLGFWPLFTDDVQGVIFVDAGTAGDNILNSALSVNIGGELQFSFVLGYAFPMTVHVGAVWIPSKKNLSWYGRVSELRF